MAWSTQCYDMIDKHMNVVCYDSDTVRASRVAIFRAWRWNMIRTLQYSKAEA